jgi:hypothetical protein
MPHSGHFQNKHYVECRVADICKTNIVECHVPGSSHVTSLKYVPGEFAKCRIAAESGTMFILSTCPVLRVGGGGRTMFCTALRCICKCLTLNRVFLCNILLPHKIALNFQNMYVQRVRLF